MKSARPRKTGTSAGTAPDSSKINEITVNGQCAEVLALIRQHQPIMSLRLTADFAIPETAARIHDLRDMGFNIRTRIEPYVEFRGRVRRNVAFYSLGTPEYIAPEAADKTGGDQ